jgi:hypothetical protein
MQHLLTSSTGCPILTGAPTAVFRLGRQNPAVSEVEEGTAGIGRRGLFWRKFEPACAPLGWRG